MADLSLIIFLSEEKTVSSHPRDKTSLSGPSTQRLAHCDTGRGEAHPHVPGILHYPSSGAGIWSLGRGTPSFPVSCLSVCGGGGQRTQ